MAANEMGSLVFIDDVTAARSSRMNPEVCGVTLYFTEQMDDDPKQTANATEGFLEAKKCHFLHRPTQSPDLDPIEDAFQLLKTKLKAERPIKK